MSMPSMRKARACCTLLVVGDRKPSSRYCWWPVPRSIRKTATAKRLFTGQREWENPTSSISCWPKVQRFSAFNLRFSSLLQADIRGKDGLALDVAAPIDSIRKALHKSSESANPSFQFVLSVDRSKAEQAEELVSASQVNFSASDVDPQWIIDQSEIKFLVKIQDERGSDFLFRKRLALELLPKCSRLCIITKRWPSKY